MPFTTRRNFLSGLAGAGASLAAMPVLSERAFANLFKANTIAGDRSPAEVATDESYWSQIQRSFDIDRTMINLNNGGISPTPTHVLEQMVRDLKFVNELPVEHNWRVLEPRIVLGRSARGVDWGHEKVHIVLLAISPPESTAEAHLDLVHSAAALVRTWRNRQKLLEAEGFDAIAGLLSDATS